MSTTVAVAGAPKVQPVEGLLSITVKVWFACVALSVAMTMVTGLEVSPSAKETTWLTLVKAALVAVPGLVLILTDAGPEKATLRLMTTVTGTPMVGTE